MDATIQRDGSAPGRWQPLLWVPQHTWALPYAEAAWRCSTLMGSTAQYRFAVGPVQSFEHTLIW